MTTIICFRRKTDTKLRQWKALERLVRLGEKSMSSLSLLAAGMSVQDRRLRASSTVLPACCHRHGRLQLLMVVSWYVVVSSQWRRYSGSSSSSCEGWQCRHARPCQQASADAATDGTLPVSVSACLLLRRWHISSLSISVFRYSLYWSRYFLLQIELDSIIVPCQPAKSVKCEI